MILKVYCKRCTEQVSMYQMATCQDAACAVKEYQRGRPGEPKFQYEMKFKTETKTAPGTEVKNVG